MTRAFNLHNLVNPIYAPTVPPLPNMPWRPETSETMSVLPTSVEATFLASTGSITYTAS